MGNIVGKNEAKHKSFLVKSLEAHTAGVNTIELNAELGVLVSGSDDSTIRMWNIKNEPYECIGLMEGHGDYVTCVLIEENFVLSSSADSTMRKWDMATCECAIVFKGHESTVNKIVCTGDFIFTISYDKTARMWDFDTGDCVRVFRGHKNNLTSILFVPSERENLEAAIDFIKSYAEEKHFELKDRQLVPGTSVSASVKTGPNGEVEQDETEIYSKDIIITGSLDNSARSWSIETGECVHTFRGHTSGVTCLAIDPTGKLLFTGSADHDIRSWEIMTGQLLKIFTGHVTTVLSLLAHRKLLYSTSSDQTAKCWVMEFGDCTRTYKDHRHSVPALIENEGLVFTACGDGIARCFDGKSGAVKRTFSGHTSAINCLRFANDRLFTGSVDGTVKVFDASNLTADKDESLTFSEENDNNLYREDIEDY